MTELYFCSKPGLRVSEKSVVIYFRANFTPLTIFKLLCELSQKIGLDRFRTLAVLTLNEYRQPDKHDLEIYSILKECAWN